MDTFWHRPCEPQGMLKLVFDQSNGRILGVHIIGTDACELIHYGMELINAERTIFDMMSTMFTAVTFHEMFKTAALDGNAKLRFGVQWTAILEELKDSFGKEKVSLREIFEDIDEDGSGELDAQELQKMLSKRGKDVSVGTLNNMLRLADEDGSGTICIDEFESIFAAVGTEHIAADVLHPVKPEAVAQESAPKIATAVGSPPAADAVGSLAPTIAVSPKDSPKEVAAAAAQ